jgi:hypothetical protein
VQLLFQTHKLYRSKSREEKEEQVTQQGSEAKDGNSCLFIYLPFIKRRCRS